MEVIMPAPYSFHIPATAWKGCDPYPAATQTGPHSPSARPAHAHTSWNEKVFVNYLIESFSIFFFFFWAVVFTLYSLGKYFTKLECIMQFQWDLLESSLLVLLR